MQSTQAINLIKNQFDTLRTQYDVRHLSLFGSVARNEAKPQSDIDILVEFNGKPNFDRFMGLKFFLEDILHTHVDLVTKEALRPRMRSLIESELIYVA
jgi:predicted nucleotidyltransferase